MKVGGYQIVDLKNTDFELSESTVVDGVHEAIANANGKPCLIKDFSISSEKVGGVYVLFARGNNDSYEGVISYGNSPLSIAITADDNVTISQNN